MKKLSFMKTKNNVTYIKKVFFRNEKEKYKHIKVRDQCHYTGKFRAATHSTCNLRYVPKKFPIMIHNCSTYDDHFIIKQIPVEFEGQFKCLGENTEKYITYSLPIKKEVTNDEENDGDDSDVDEKRKQLSID